MFIHQRIEKGYGRASPVRLMQIQLADIVIGGKAEVDDLIEPLEGKMILYFTLQGL